MRCPICQHKSQIKAAPYASDAVRVNYHICKNPACRCKFKSITSIAGVLSSGRRYCRYDNPKVAAIIDEVTMRQDPANLKNVLNFSSA